MSIQLDSTTIPEIKLNDTEKFYERLAEIQQQDNPHEQGRDQEEDVQEEDVQEHESNTHNNDDDTSDQSNNDPEKHLIPRTRLNKELEKRKTLEAQLEKEKEERIKIQAQMEMYNSALAKMERGFNIQNKQAEEDFAPLDEKSHEILSKQIQEVKEYQQQMMMQKTLEMQQEQFINQNPDFKDAYDHLLKVQIRANQNFGYNEEEATNIALINLRGMATNLLNKNMNVAEKFYNIAKEYGYSNKPKAKTSNLEAINNNMKKSKTVDTGVMPVPMSNGGSKYTKLAEFSKHYKGNKETFQQMLNAVKGDQLN